MSPCLLFILATFSGVDPAFENYSVAQGLTSNQVLAIGQDRQGYMWFGTKNGLNRFNGYAFKQFRPLAGDPGSLSDSFVQVVLGDSSGYLWAGTRRGGLNRYDPARGTFTHFRADADNPTSLPADNVTALYEDRSGTLWVGTLGGGLSRFHAAGERFETFRHKPDITTSLSSDRVRSIVQDREGSLWIGTRSGLNRMNANGTFTRFLPEPGREDWISNEHVYSLAEAFDGGLWVGTFTGGLNYYDPNSNRFTVYQHDPRDSGSLAGDRIWKLFVDSAGTLWVGTQDSGLSRFNASTGQFETFRHDRFKPGSLASDLIWSVFEDSGHSLWIGTSDQGIDKHSPNLKKFVHYQRNPLRPKEPEDFKVTALSAGDNGRLWIGTWKQGIMSMDTATNQFQPYGNRTTPDGAFRGVLYLYEDSRGTVWASIWNKGLVRLDPETGGTESFKWQTDERPGPKHVVTFIAENKAGELLLGTYSEGLLRFDRETKTFSPIAPDPSGDTLLSEIVFAFEVDDQQRFWVATGNGLCRLDGEKMTRYNYNPEDPDSLSNDHVVALVKDLSGAMWIGTEGGGLNRWNPEQDNFFHLDTRNGLAGDQINGMIADELGHIWVATNGGMMKLNPETLQMETFTPADGIQLGIYAGAACRGPNGALYFGGSEGLNRFQPTKLFRNEHIPPVIIESVKRFNQTNAPALQLSGLDRVDLTYRDSFIELEFAALDFFAPNKNQYAVKLEGLSDAWMPLGNKRSVTYSNLDGGTYTLHVRGSNNDGVWNETGTSLTLVVQPPYWQTWWFRSLVVILAVALVITMTSLIYVGRIRKIERIRDAQKEAKRLLAEGREVERLELARVLHDGPIQDLHALQLQLGLHQVSGGRTNARFGASVLTTIARLRALCGELRPPALGPFGLAAAFQAHIELMEAREPHITFESSFADKGLDLPKDTALALFRIGQEALNNAVRHANADRISIRFEADAERLVLMVIDNGLGFQMQANPVTFSKQGHFGLLGISERAESLGGKLTVTTGPNEGTVIRVTAPKPAELDFVRTAESA